MGNSTSRVVGCFVPSGNVKDGVNLDFLEPLDEGLGHSFCYVRPVIADSPAITPSNSERFTVDSSNFDSETHSGSFRQEIADDFAGMQKLNKNFSETTFKTISGASVSANASAARTVNPNLLPSGDAQEPAATFESTASFSAIPLQPVPRGSGPLNGFMSGPLERGFTSGPLERGLGFMSGPLDKGAFMSGPLDSMDRSNFSAPLAYGQRRAGLRRLVRNMSRPMTSALSRTFTRRLPGSGWVQRFFLHPMTRFQWHHKEARPEAQRNCVEIGPSETDYSNARNLQWAHGKAGEDRVHVVLSEEQGWLFVSIYDGFSGPDAPDFLMGNLYKTIDKELQGLLWDYEDRPRKSTSPPSILQCDSTIVSSYCLKEESTISKMSNEDSGKESAVSRSSRKHLEKQCSEGILAVPPTEDDYREVLVVDKGSQVDPIKADEIVEEKDGIKAIGQSPKATEVREGYSTNSNKSKDPAGATAYLGQEVSASKTAWQYKKSKRLFELLRMELMEEYSLKDSQSISDLGSRRMSSCDLHSSASEDMCVRETSPAAELVSCSASIRGESSRYTEDAGSVRENEGVLGEHTKEPKHQSGPSFSVSEHKQTMKRSLIGSRLRKMYIKQKSLRKKLFPWSYDWHRDQSYVDERGAGPSVVIRRCKSGPVDHDAVLKAMSRALELTEAAYMEMVEKSLDKNAELALMGSCVLVMLMKDQDVYVMNLGDSRVILAQDRLNDHSLGSNLPNDDGRQRHRSREPFIHVELDRISEESPMHNLNARICKTNKNREISICRLKMRAIQLSTDHSTSIEEEVMRIKAEHVDDCQAVFNDRVKGQLKVTRAFGAGFLKKPKFNEPLLEMFRIDYVGTSPYISCIPSVLHRRLSSNDRFLVLSSDGLYEYFSNEEVVSHVAWFMENVPEGDPAQYLVAELLFRAAKKNGMDFHDLLDIPHGDRRKYHDDVSVMVISLEGRIWRSSG